VPIVTVLDGQVVGAVARGTMTVIDANAKLVELHTAAHLAPPKLLVSTTVKPS
jgi:hypothetical protein